ncbi:TonB-dependent receptor [Echinimonas agarilytica]|uniref:TonB-dependent receptor n=1 Tax=Echinimonas agarilytica TaxID=1215918 RepID=A0AA42B6U1_9GAMM|nr:TonB-dependent receptor [Echinimonas agarilytica]MCM2678713.1 TonB-dependent receptor [Echinimonas agarilytica]
MFRRHKIARSIQRCLWASLALSLISPQLQAAEEAKESETQSLANAEDVETISVTGVRSSLREAAFLKKSADQIMDAISAEDIGQLPDNNIAEALQRVTGVQIDRDDTGEGSGFQVRGLTQNKVEIDGMSMADSGEDGINNFDAVDSALFSSIEVIKTPMADMKAGAIGATIRLNTKEPLRYKQPVFNVNLKGTRDELADDDGHKLVIAGGRKFDLDKYGEIGGSFTFTTSETFKQTDTFNSAWGPLKANQVEPNQMLEGKTVFAPTNLKLTQNRYEEEQDSLSGAIQWAPSERLSFLISANYMEKTRDSVTDRMTMVTTANSGNIIARDQDGSEWDDSPVVLGAFTRDAVDGELVNVGTVQNPDYQAADTVERYILQRATIYPAGAKTVNMELEANQKITEQYSYIFKSEYIISDDLEMEIALSTSGSEETTENYKLAYGPDQGGVDEDGNSYTGVLTDNNVFYDYETGSDLPVFGVQAIGYREGIVDDILTDPAVYQYKNVKTDKKKTENVANGAQIDFDWYVDQSFLTKIEFGAYAGNKETTREKYTTDVATLKFDQHSIFSEEWLEYDNDWNTYRDPQNAGGTRSPAYEWMGTVMGWLYNQPNYLNDLSHEVDSFFPNGNTSNAQNVPAWISPDVNFDGMVEMVNYFFPGREGNCAKKSQCNTQYSAPTEPGFVYPGDKEYDGILNMPGVAFNSPDQAYPYKNTQDHWAVYLKGNFETDFIFGIPAKGNFGVRYVGTRTENVGIDVTNFIDMAGKALKYTTDEGNENNVNEYDPVVFKKDYTNVLPSGNISFGLTEDMFLRFAMYKSMNRPSPKDTSPSLNYNAEAWNVNIGNPLLKAETAVSFDASWEWYMDDINSFSAAYFRKDLSDFLVENFFTDFSPTDRDGNGLLDDPVTFKQKVNGGDGTINGVELGASHVFEYLPSFLNGFGVQANYTYTDSSQDSGYSELDGAKLPIPKLSENSVNFILFYDKYGFNFRAAYNYRDESYAGQSNAGPDISIQETYLLDDELDYRYKGVLLPVWNDEFDTLDISMSYKYDAFKVYFQATNVTGETKRTYVGDKESTKHLTAKYNDTGTQYSLGASYTF